MHIMITKKEEGKNTSRTGPPTGSIISYISMTSMFLLGPRNALRHNTISKFVYKAVPLPIGIIIAFFKKKIFGTPRSAPVPGAMHAPRSLAILPGVCL